MTEEIPELTPPRLLVVEDDRDTLVFLKHVLGQEYETVCAESGEEALRCLKTQSFDLVLVDVIMQQISGLDVLKHIRATPATADLPVVLLSALAHHEDIVKGLQQGANDYITKPFDIEVMKARIKCQMALKERLDQQKRAISALKTTYESKERFLQITSHDLKNPLNVILIAQYHLRTIVGDNKDATESLDIIENTVNEMTNLVGDYLDLSHLESGKLELNFRPVNVEEAVWEVANRYDLASSRKNIKLRLNEMSGTVMADYDRFVQIVSNLVSNAIKFSPPDHTVSISSEVVGNLVQIQVSDEGPGISKEDYEKLFTPYGKLSARPTAGENSTGLGLWIVHELVEMHKGQVGVMCPADGGAIFWVNMPAHQEAV